MNLPSDFFARIKDITARQARDFGRVGDTVLREWLFLLIFGLLLTVAVSLYAAYRFNYWSNLEERLFEDEPGPELYDRAAAEKILREFDARAEQTQRLLESADQSSATGSESLAE